MLPKIDRLERRVYAEICSSDGLKAKEIAQRLNVETTVINKLLYSSKFMNDLCYQDGMYRWHGIIRQTFPHTGLRDFCGYYSSVADFLVLSEEEWLNKLADGCTDIGRSLNDNRGLIHSFKDCRLTMIKLFADLQEFGESGCPDWEIAFEFRIRKTKYIRIFADVLVITPDKVFTLEFKMKNKIETDELEQAAKYAMYLDVIFGPRYDVLPALVLTGTTDLFGYTAIPGTEAVLLTCSGDMLFNVFNEIMGFI